MTIQKCNQCGAEMTAGTQPSERSYPIYVQDKLTPDIDRRVLQIEAAITFEWKFSGSGRHFCTECLEGALIERMQRPQEEVANTSPTPTHSS